MNTSTVASTSQATEPTQSGAAKPRSASSAKTASAPGKRPSSKSAPVKAKRASPRKAPQAAKTAKTAQASSTEQPKAVKKVAPSPATKEKKVKVVRDSFTIPKNEFSQLGDMKKKALGLGMDIKKSELIRAGLLLLNAAPDAAFKKALANVPTLKTGRPGKN